MNRPNKQKRMGKITFFKGEKTGCESIFQQIFGKIPENSTLFSLTAAPEGTLLTIGMDDEGLLFELMEPVRFGLTAQFRIFYNESGQKEIRIDDYRFLRRGIRNRGMGTELFIRLIQTAAEWKFSVVSLPDDSLTNEINTHFFSRLGFLPEPQQSTKDKSRTKNRHSLSESAGEKWIFDLSPYSRSLAIFNQFRQKRKIA